MLTNWIFLECSWAPLSFALQIVAKLIFFCLCLFDAIIELRVMVENVQWFSLWEVILDVICSKRVFKS